MPEWLEDGKIEDIMAESITLTLTKAEYEMLNDILSTYTDEGPVDEGWSSPKLKALQEKVRSEGITLTGADGPE